MKKILFLLLLTILLISPIHPAAAKPQTADPDPYSLIAAVNDLRTSNGLPAYTVSPILMTTAQNHADYMSRNGVSHDEGGITFADRLANAGYALGVFRSENISAGMNQSVQDTVLQWQGDDLHWHTMMSPDLMEIGAGVTIVNGYVYYVIDCATPLGGKPIVNTLAPGETRVTTPVYVGPPLAKTVVPSTPNAEGKLIHVVAPGETLWLIAVTYKKTILEIRELNYMSDTDAIYPGEKLLIAKNITVTPAPVVLESVTPSASSDEIGVLSPIDDIDATPTIMATATDLSAYTSTPLPTLPLPTTLQPVNAAPIMGPVAINANLLIAGVIILAALILSALLIFAGREGK